MSPTTDAVFVVYSRKDCHLCEEMIAALKSMRPRPYKKLSTVDISGRPELERRFTLDIPVLEIDGIAAFRYRTNPEELRSWLASSDRTPYDA